jgi:hypothetical protein
MNRLRIPFFLLALIVILAAVLIEFGAVSATNVAARLPAWALGRRTTSVNQAFDLFPAEQRAKLLAAYQKYQQKANETAAITPDLKGFGAGSLRFVDLFLVFTLALMAMSLVVPESIHSRIQGILTLIFSIIVIILAIVSIFMILAKLLLMVGLLLSIPFGTIIYLIIYADFPRSAAAAVVALLFLLRILFVFFLVLAHEGFLQNIGLVVYTLVAFIASLLVSILYAIVPGILVSITDAIAALIVAIIGIILAIILLIGAIISIVMALKP